MSLKTLGGLLWITLELWLPRAAESEGKPLLCPELPPTPRPHTRSLSARVPHRGCLHAALAAVDF